MKRHKSLVRDDDGSLREIRPQNTLLYLMYLLYVNQPPLNDRMHQTFRNRFRLPYESFLSLSVDISGDPFFAKWPRTDTIDDKPMNLKLLLLRYLIYIG